MINSSKVAFALDFNSSLNYSANGTWTSPWFDTNASGLVTAWQDSTIIETVGTGNTTVYEYRFANASDKSDATAWTITLSGQQYRYVQARITLKRVDNTASPVIDKLVIKPEARNFESSTNLALYSQDLDNAYWLKSNATITPNCAAAPDGAWTADRLVESATTTSHYLYKGSLISQTKIVTVSLFVKADGRDWFCIDFANSNLRAYFNVASGTIGTVTAGILSTSISSAGNGWYRISATCLPTASTLNLVMCNVNNNQGYTGDGVKGVLMWGIQVEYKPAPTAYIPTTSATASSIGGKSVFVEQTSSNLLTYSEDLSNAYWTKNNMTVVSGFVAPDGSSSAYKMVDDATAGVSHNLTRASIFTTSSPGTLSFYAKKVDYDWVCASIGGGAGNYAWFNVNTGTLGTKGANITNYSITPVKNGWYRCTLYATSAPGTIAVLGVTNADNVYQYTGSGLGNLYWGVQAELKAYETSYIRTIGVAATRNAESLVVPNSVVNLSGGAFTAKVYFSNRKFRSGTSHMVFSHANVSTVWDEISCYYAPSVSGWIMQFKNGVGSSDNATWTNVPHEGWHNVGINFTSGGVADLWVDGVKRGTIATVRSPQTLGQLNIGARNNAFYWDDAIADFNVFYERLSDTEMAQYTSASGFVPLTEKHSYKLDFSNANLSHGEGGYRISNGYDLSQLIESSSGEITWTQNMPASSLVTVDISVDNGATWTPASGSTISLSGLTSGKTLKFKQKMLSWNPTAAPSISDFTVKVNQKQTAASSYIKPIGGKLVLTPSNVGKWQLENKKYATTFINGTRLRENLSVPMTSISDVSQGTIMIRAYVNGDVAGSSSQYHCLFDSRNGFGQNGICIRKEIGANLILIANNGSTTTQSFNPSSYLTNGWHTFALVWNQTDLTLKCFIDGVLRSTLSNAALPMVMQASGWIGSVNPGSGLSQYWNDAIDEVNIFGRALTDSEILAYSSGNIPISADHTYKMRFNGDIAYGTCGFATTPWVDAGINAAGTPWIDVIAEDIKPSGTDIVYWYRTSEDGGVTYTDWSNDITVNKGRYLQIKVNLVSEDSLNASPEILSIRPVPKYF